jgi:hypothetical protein
MTTRFPKLNPQIKGNECVCEHMGRLIELLGGVANLPAEFREVARKANRARMEGWEYGDAAVGLDRLPEVPAALEGRIRGAVGLAAADHVPPERADAKFVAPLSLEA